MRLALLALAAVLAAGPAAAECRDDVTAAFAKQRAAKSFRMEANVISMQGPMKMTVDYVLPDRIRQRIVFATQPDAAIEAVLIGLKSWANEGKGWAVAPGEIKAELERQLRDVAQETDDQLGNFECAGKETIDGVELSVFRSVKGPPGAGGKPTGGTEAPNEMTRLIFVDPAKGLPARTIVGRANALDRPLFKAVYSYPSEIKIEAPAAN